MSLQNWCTSYLKEKGFESARLTTDLLLSHVLKCERIQLYAHFDKPLKKEELDTFRALFKRRLEQEPLQYITGEAHFMSYAFNVDKRVLIPRPETELLVQEVLDIIKSDQEKTFQVIDIGTGSGNIAISIAHGSPKVEVDAIDVSSDALSVAEDNIKRHNVQEKVRLNNIDILNLTNGLPKPAYDIIVSNPPYISNEEFTQLTKDVKDYEPVLALKDNGDGLTFYKIISKLGIKYLTPGGWILVEIAYNQGYDVKAIFETDGYANISILQDLEKNSRVVKAQKAIA